jgi:hypothetical protein
LISSLLYCCSLQKLQIILIFQVSAGVLSCLAIVMLCKLLSLKISLFVSASGRVKLDKNIEIIYLDDDDDDDDEDGGSMSQGGHEKKAVFGIAVKNEVPSPSVATQQKSKFPNAADTVKRKFSLSDIEISSASSSSSDDSSFLDDLPIRSVVSLERRKKCRQTGQD